MKCPECGTSGSLKMTEYRKEAEPLSPFIERAILTCSMCGHEERFA
jgi:RNase P subunit RPR2